MTFLEAVAREEGFYAHGTRPQRNNNPGDIEWHPVGVAARNGATHGDPRFAVFPTEQAGFAAMRALFNTAEYCTLNVEQALNRWAPPIENQTNRYIANVCEWTGCKPTDKVITLLELPSFSSKPTTK